MSSSKQPDQCIVPTGQDLPTVVVESGWTESLHRDMSLWLKGGAGAVRIVLLFKWSKKLAGNRVKGYVEVYNLDPAANENLIQTEVITNRSNIVRSNHMKLMADGTRPFPNINPGGYSRSSSSYHYSRAAIRICNTRW